MNRTSRLNKHRGPSPGSAPRCKRKRSGSRRVAPGAGKAVVASSQKRGLADPIGRGVRQATGRDGRAFRPGNTPSPRFRPWSIFSLAGGFAGGSDPQRHYLSNFSVARPDRLPPRLILTPAPADADIVGILQRSSLFLKYWTAFEATTGLPLVLREAGSFRSPLQGSKRVNPFCALMAGVNPTCSACLQLQQRLEENATQSAKTLECYAGLSESAVPVRVGDMCSVIRAHARGVASGPQPAAHRQGQARCERVMRPGLALHKSSRPACRES